eukprot:750336-Hanusia_phi.AAC.4
MRPAPLDEDLNPACLPACLPASQLQCLYPFLAEVASSHHRLPDFLAGQPPHHARTSRRVSPSVVEDFLGLPQVQHQAQLRQPRELIPHRPLGQRRAEAGQGAQVLVELHRPHGAEAARLLP